jgi:O-antigen/teichoic acid export membrane protein
MATDSLAYAAFALVVNLVEFSVVQNLYGRLAGPVGVTGFSVLVMLTSAMLGFVLMITTPMWPAVVDALARGDVAWVRRTAWRLWMYVTGFAAVCGVVLVVLGPTLLPMWVGPKAQDLDRPVMLAFAVYFLLFAWRHANHMLVVGVGRVRSLALIQLAESALVLGAAWFGMNHGGLATLLLAMAAAIAVVTGWMLPGLFYRELGRVRAAPAVEPGDGSAARAPRHGGGESRRARAVPGWCGPIVIRGGPGPRNWSGLG